MNHLVSRQECARTPKEDLVVHPTVLLDWSRWVLAKGTSNRSSRWRKRWGRGQDKFKSRTHKSRTANHVPLLYIHRGSSLFDADQPLIHGYTHSCHPLTYPMSVRIRQERVRFQKTREIYRPPSNLQWRIVNKMFSNLEWTRISFQSREISFVYREKSRSYNRD